MKTETILTIAVDISKEMKELWEHNNNTFEDLINHYSQSYCGNHVFNTKIYILTSSQSSKFNYHMGIILASSFKSEQNLEIVEDKNFSEYCEKTKNIINETTSRLFNIKNEAKLMMLNLYY